MHCKRVSTATITNQPTLTAKPHTSAAARHGTCHLAQTRLSTLRIFLYIFNHKVLWNSDANTIRDTMRSDQQRQLAWLLFVIATTHLLSAQHDTVLVRVSRIRQHFPLVKEARELPSAFYNYNEVIFTPLWRRRRRHRCHHHHRHPLLWTTDDDEREEFGDYRRLMWAFCFRQSNCFASTTWIIYYYRGKKRRWCQRSQLNHWLQY